MKEKYEFVRRSDRVDDNDKYYWGYQYRLAHEVLVPLLSKLHAFEPGYTVTEIGCAEGGVLAAFVDAGARNALGTDIAKSRLEKGEIISEMIETPIKFVYHDLLKDGVEPEWQSKSDLVLLRDVIEHLDDTVIALEGVKEFLKPGGLLYVTFPPYHSPFGGHQQTLMNTWGKFPYIHLLPNAVFHRMIASGRPNDIGEVKRLQNIRMTPKKFIDAARETGFEIVKQDYYLLRPVFKMKFGLPAIKITPVSGLPLVKSFLSLEASYLLKKSVMKKK